MCYFFFFQNQENESVTLTNFFIFFPASVQPVAVFPLKRAFGGLELISRSNLATFSYRVIWSEDDAIQFVGTPDSFIEIPNSPGSYLDTKTSITLLIHVFPFGNRGPIISFQEHGLGVQIWHDGVFDGKGVLTARFAWRDFSQPPDVSKAVLNLNAWNFIGASYDHESGMARLWHDGNEAQAMFIGKNMELATQSSIRIGALADDTPARCFRGKVADFRIFSESLERGAVRSAGGIVSEGNSSIHD